MQSDGKGSWTYNPAIDPSVTRATEVAKVRAHYSKRHSSRGAESSEHKDSSKYSKLKYVTEITRDGDS